MADKDPQLQLIEALLAVQRELGPISKSHEVKTNSGQRMYTYADLADTLAVLRDPLANNGLALIQTFAVEDGAPLLVTTLYHMGGGSLSSQCPIGVYGKPQDAGSAITYYRRYAIMALLCLATEDNDAEKVAQVKPQSEADKVRLAFFDRTLPKLDELRRVDPETAGALLFEYGATLSGVPPKDYRKVLEAIKAAIKQAEAKQDEALEN